MDGGVRARFTVLAIVLVISLLLSFFWGVVGVLLYCRGCLGLAVLLCFSSLRFVYRTQAFSLSRSSNGYARQHTNGNHVCS